MKKSAPAPRQIALRDVSRAFGRTFALHRITLTLREGSVSALVGDNGAGKSTLLNLLATLDQPTAGSLVYDDLSAQAFGAHRRHRIGLVGHETMLYGELTARENLAFFAAFYGLSEPDSRIQSWLRRVGLEDDADRPVKTFSRGMKQRLALARALLHAPQLVLLDEPATGLDQRGRELLMSLLEELRAAGRIVVLVTHDLSLVDAVADHIVVLRRGRLVLDSPRAEIADLVGTYREVATR